MGFGIGRSSVLWDIIVHLKYIFSSQASTSTLERERERHKINVLYIQNINYLQSGRKDIPPWDREVRQNGFVMSVYTLQIEVMMEPKPVVAEEEHRLKTL